MFSSLGIIFIVLVYCKGQLRPSNWDMDVMSFGQNDWNRYDRDFGQNGRRPYPSFRPNIIPTQKPPIVGQIPGQIGGRGGQKGQSGNDNIPPPLPPMPRQPGTPKALPVPSQPPPFDLGGGLNPSTADKVPPGNGPLPPLSPSPGSEEVPEPSEPPPKAGFGPQDQLPPPMEPSPTVGEEGSVLNATEVPNQSETPPPMSGEGEATSTQASVGGDTGFSFGMDMDVGGFGQEVSTMSQEKFGFSGEDAFPTLQPDVGIDQRGGLAGVAGDLTVENSEHKERFMPPPRSKLGQSATGSMEHKVQGAVYPGLNQMGGSVPELSPVKLQKHMGGLGAANLRPVEGVKQGNSLDVSSRNTKG